MIYISDKITLLEITAHLLIWEELTGHEFIRPNIIILLLKRL
jgi:hypothetical protein